MFLSFIHIIGRIQKLITENACNTLVCSLITFNDVWVELEHPVKLKVAENSKYSGQNYNKDKEARSYNRCVFVSSLAASGFSNPV